MIIISRLLKNGHLLRFPRPSSMQRTVKYASLLRTSGAFHLALFEKPRENDFFNSLLKCKAEVRSKGKRFEVRHEECALALYNNRILVLAFCC